MLEDSKELIRCSFPLKVFWGFVLPCQKCYRTANIFWLQRIILISAIVLFDLTVLIIVAWSQIGYMSDLEPYVEGTQIWFEMITVLCSHCTGKICVTGNVNVALGSFVDTFLLGQNRAWSLSWTRVWFALLYWLAGIYRWSCLGFGQCSC